MIEELELRLPVIADGSTSQPAANASFDALQCRRFGGASSTYHRKDRTWIRGRAQHAVDPATRRLAASHRPQKHDVRRHHCRQSVGVRRDRAADPLRYPAIRAGRPEVHVHRRDRSVPGKCLVSPPFPHRACQAYSERDSPRSGIRRECTVADRAADAVVDVHAGRERHVTPPRAIRRHHHRVPAQRDAIRRDWS